MWSRDGQGDQPASWLKHLERTVPHRFTHAIEHDVIAGQFVFDALLAVVDYFVSSERAQQLMITGACRGGA